MLAEFNTSALTKEPWNQGRLIGQKAPLKVSDVWAIRIRLQITGQIRELALFNLAIDSKLRACDLVKLKSATSAAARNYYIAPPSCSRNPINRFNLRLLH